MIRAVALAALLVTLAACGAVLGPSQADLETGVREFYARGETASVPDLSEAHISSYEGCQPRGGIFTCPVVFTTEQGNRPILIWVIRTPSGGWEVRNLRDNGRRR
ncbi:MAG: hypothetical protein ABL932_10265 [Terricaulis sp.]